MANEVTTSADVIDPIVWADSVAPVIFGKALLVQSGMATTDDTLAGEPGSTVAMPKWKYIGDAEDLQEGVAIEADRLEMTQTYAKIKEVGKAVDLTDTAKLIALSSPDSEAASQIAIAVSRKTDTDLRNAAEYVLRDSGETDRPDTSPLIVPEVAPALSWDAYVDAIAMFGDEYDPADLAGVLVHTKQYKQLLKDKDFRTVDKLGAQATILRGQVGVIGNVPVMLSDRATAISDGGAPGHNVLIVKKGALALKYKRRPLVETDRDVKRRITTVVTTTHYAVTRKDDRGVVILGVRD